MTTADALGVYDSLDFVENPVPVARYERPEEVEGTIEDQMMAHLREKHSSNTFADLARETNGLVFEFGVSFDLAQQCVLKFLDEGDELDDIELDDIPSKRDLREWDEWGDGLTISQLINSELPF